jgi:hypothetical protein
MNFFYIVINSRPFYPTTTTLLKLVDSIISAESEPDEKMREKVKWIKDYTHEEINMPLPIVELMVFKNLHGNLNREIEVGEQNFYLIELYKILDDVVIELNRIVVSIGKKYSMEIPFMNMGGAGNKFIFGDTNAPSL